MIREQAEIVVGELRLQLDRARGGIYLVVHCQQRAAAQLRLARTVVGVHCQLLAVMQFLHYRGDVVFRECKDHRDRLQLRDDNDAVGVARMHDVADIDLAQPEPTADRCGDARIGELQLGTVDLGLVRLERTFVLADQRGLRVELLFGDGILLEQRAIALEISLRVFQQRLVASHGAFGLRELDLVGPGIDLCEQVALFDHLALAEHHRAQFAVDMRPDSDSVERYDRSQPVQVKIDIAGLGRGSDHRLAAVHCVHARLAARRLRARQFSAFGLGKNKICTAAEYAKRQQPYPGTPPPCRGYGGV